MLWSWAIFTFGYIVGIYNGIWMKNKPTIETFFIIISIWNQITVFWFSISIDIFTIFEIFIRIIECWYRDNELKCMNLISDIQIFIVFLSIFYPIPVITPLTWLTIDFIWRIRWKCADKCFSCFLILSFKKSEIIFIRKLSSSALFWTKCGKWKCKFLSSDNGGECIEEGDFCIRNNEHLSWDATSTSDGHT